MTCQTCGLDTSTHKGRGCPKRKRASGKKPPRQILSLDCETNSNGIVLFLAAGESRDSADYIYNADGLKLPEILDWLIRAGAGRLCFGFFFDYDVNQIVRLLPEVHQSQLAANGVVTWKGYRVRHTPGKRFQVSNGAASVCIWDCSSWAQCSFLSVCTKWKLGTENERGIVARMKAKRGDFDSATESELVEYTTLECALLTEWVRRLLELHAECGIVLRAYSGPGSTASAMIRQREWKPPEVPDEIGRQPKTRGPSDPGGIAFRAFFGGRTEISCMGAVPGPIYGYDINSAYPDGIASLPEIRDQKWKKSKRFNAGAWGFYRVRWQQKKNSAWGLFPVRGACKSGSLLYPTEGEGWFHSEEISAAMELDPNALEVLDARLVTDIGQRPFGWVRDEAARRLEYKAAGDERAFPLKVGLNSIYGKLAQRSGTHPLQCAAYAAAITSRTRAQLLRAAYHRGHDVFLLATDGILSTVPLPELMLGATLGSWEHETYPSAWMLQAGVYWAGDKKKTRGIDARTLELEDVKALWWRKETAAVLTLPARRVLSYRLCASQGKLHQTGTWYDGLRSVRFTPMPRRRSYRWRGDRLLTIPARTADFVRASILDVVAMAFDDGAGFDEFEALPDWALPDD